jgi:hypothetical protein
MKHGEQTIIDCEALRDGIGSPARCVEGDPGQDITVLSQACAVFHSGRCVS